MSQGKDFKFKKTLDTNEAVSYLQDLIKSIKGGSMRFECGEEVISLSPQSTVSLGLSAKKKEGKESFSFEVAWSTEQEEEGAKPMLKISSEPAGKKVASEPAETKKKKEGQKAA